MTPKSLRGAVRISRTKIHVNVFGLNVAVEKASLVKALADYEGDDLALVDGADGAQHLVREGERPAPVLRSSSPALDESDQPGLPFEDMI